VVRRQRRAITHATARERFIKLTLLNKLRIGLNAAPGLSCGRKRCKSCALAVAFQTGRSGAASHDAAGEP